MVRVRETATLLMKVTYLSVLCFFLYTEALSQPVCQNPAQYWHHLTSLQVKNVKLAILPVGSTESHGPHLPLGTDILLAESLVKFATDGLSNVAILPPTSYGASFEHSSHPGTIPLRDETLHGLWNEVIEGVVSAGVRKVLIVNGHGGQTPNAQIVARNVRFRSHALAVLFDVQASLTEAYVASHFPQDEEIKKREERYGIHGGLIETAVMSYLFPNLVDQEQAGDFEPTWTSHSPLEPYGRVISYGWKSEDLCQHGAIGNASMARPQLGREVFERSVTALRNAIIKILSTKPEDVLNI